MPTPGETHIRLAAIPQLTVLPNAPLSNYTRFGIGGPADLYAETEDAEAFVAAMNAVRETALPLVVIGGGTNLIVSDQGFRGVVLRYRADRLMSAREWVNAQAGASLQDLIDFTIARGL